MSSMKNYIVYLQVRVPAYRSIQVTAESEEEARKSGRAMADTEPLSEFEVDWGAVGPETLAEVREVEEARPKEVEQEPI